MCGARLAMVYGASKEFGIDAASALIGLYARAKFRSADPHLQPAAIWTLLTVPFDFTKYCDVPV